MTAIFMLRGAPTAHEFLPEKWLTVPKAGELHRLGLAVPAAPRRRRQTARIRSAFPISMATVRA